MPQTKSDMNGAEVLLEQLECQGVECIFASPIAVMAPVWEALARRGNEMKLRYFRCHHEPLAVSLASGYYKATGRTKSSSYRHRWAFRTDRWPCAQRCNALCKSWQRARCSCSTSSSTREEVGSSAIPNPPDFSCQVLIGFSWFSVTSVLDVCKGKSE